MRFARLAVPRRCRPPLPLLVFALCAAAGAAPAQEVAGSGVLALPDLELSAEPNALATAAFELSHAGAPGKRLAFRVTPSSTACDATSPIAWLVVEPSAGEIEADSVATLSVYASAFGAAAPRRTGFLCIATSDAARPLREVRVVLTIQAGAPPGATRPGG